MKIQVFTGLMLMCLMVITVLASGKSYGTDDAADIYLYFHTDGSSDAPVNMSLVGPATGADQTVSEGDHLDFVLNQTLRSNLTAIGIDLSNGRKGFRAKLQISRDNLPFTTTNATLSLWEDRPGNLSDVKVAESEARPSQTDWEIYFVDPDVEEYTFSEGSTIILRVTCHSTNSLGYISVHIENDFSLHMIARPLEGRLEVYPFDFQGMIPDGFQPNLPDHARYMNVTGEIRDAFGPYAVGEVRISVRADGGTGDYILRDQKAAKIYMNNYCIYYYEWHWEMGELEPTDPDDFMTKYVISVSYTYPSTDPGGDNITFINDTGKYNAFDVWEYAIYMEFDDHSTSKNFKGSPGEDVNMTLLIYNSGTSQATVELEGGATQGDLSILSPYDRPFGLPARDHVSVNATIKIPENVSIGKEIGITFSAGASEGGPNSVINAKVTVTEKVAFDFIPLSNLTQEVREGMSAIYDFIIINRGSANTTFNFIISTYPTKGWSADLTPESGEVSLEPNDEATITLTVTAPSPAGASPEWQNLTVIAYPKKHSDRQKRITTHTHLKRFEIMTIEMTSAESEVISTDPWRYSTATYSISIRNGEDEDQTVLLKVMNVGNVWAVSLDQRPLDIQSGAVFSIEAGTTVEKTLGFTPSSSVTPKTYTFTVTVEFEESGMSDSEDLTVSVEQRAIVDLINTGTSSFSVKPGRKVTVSLSVTNKGNGNDNISVRLQGISLDWTVRMNGEVYMEPLRLDLAPGESEDVILEIIVPDEKVEAKTYDVRIVAESSVDHQETSTVEITIKVKERREEQTPMEILQQMLPLIAGVLLLVAFAAAIRARRKRK